MNALSERDKRTLRIGAIVLGAYLLIFFGIKGWRNLEQGRAGYGVLVARAQHEEQALRRHENDLLRFEKLSAAYRLDPRKLPGETLVAEAAAAIQNAARQGGFQLGPMRETPGRANAREISTIQFGGAGPVPAALTLVHKLQTLGFPLMIDSLRFAQDPKKPGMIELNVTVVILDFEQWKKGTAPNA